MVSILICSIKDSPYLNQTIKSIENTVKNFQYEILIDVEKERTGLKNTPNRYMKLFKQSKGDFIVKSDDDVLYYDGWLNKCIECLFMDKKLAYVSPISHYLMLKLNIKNANDDRMPIDSDTYNYEESVSGMCWVFKRKLWLDIPYDLVNNTWRLDGAYSKLVKSHGYKIGALNGALVRHLSSIPVNNMYRYKGIMTDKPGQKPSEEFKKNNSNFNFNIF